MTKEKLQKVQALAERGIAGEKENAGRILERLRSQEQQSRHLVVEVPANFNLAAWRQAAIEKADKEAELHAEEDNPLKNYYAFLRQLELEDCEEEEEEDADNF